MKKLLRSKKSQLGFTLIELLIAVSIIIILITIGAVSYSTANRNARDAQRKTDLRRVSAALEEYYADQHEYPIIPTSGTTWSDLGNCLSGGGGPGCLGANVYLKTIPNDPLSSNPKYSYNKTIVGTTVQKYWLIATLEGGGTYRVDSPNQ